MGIKYYKELDGIRGLAAIMVLLYHFFSELPPQYGIVNTLKNVSVIGQSGVSLFFVLSGFLITRILFSTKGTRDFLKNFYIKRTLRIFPLYFLFLGLYYFIAPFVLDKPFFSFTNQIYFWMFMQDFAMTFNWENDGPMHFWSLAVEEHYYMFWPLIIQFLNLKKTEILVITILISAFIVRVLLHKYNLETYYFTFARMDDITMGAFLAIAEAKGKLTTGLLKTSAFFLFTMCVFKAVALGFDKTSELAQTIQLFFSSFKFNILAVAYFTLLVLVLTIKETSIIKKVFSKGLLSFSGKISYGLYVYHPLLFTIFYKYFATQYVVVDFIICVLAAYIIAWASFKWIESPFLRLKYKFTNLHLSAR